MYYYIVDPQKTSQKEFERVQNVLYSSLSEFRISGEVVRVTGLRTVQQLVENAFSHEAKTVVAVGNDDTLHEVINAVGKREMTIGYIPLVDSDLAEVLGIKDVVQAVKTIAFRRIQELDLGLVNDYYFLSKLSFGVMDGSLRKMFNLPSFEINFSGDEKFKASQNIIGGLIINSRIDSKEKIIGNPTDGILDVLLLPQISNWNALRYRREILVGEYEKIPLASMVHVTKIQIADPAGMPLKIGGKVAAKSPAVITIVPKMLKMIVGKERDF